MTYQDFLQQRASIGWNDGFEPRWLPDFLHDFQRHLCDWAIRKGRAAIFADCGLGKTPMQLVWAQNVVEETNGRVLILTPLAVGPQTIRESQKFAIPSCHLATDGHIDGPGVYVANYERLHYFRPDDFQGIVCDESSILKHFSGATQKAVTRFMGRIPYRLLCTATAAPNDYTELGTSSEALGNLSYTDMIGRFFVLNDKKRSRMNDVKMAREANTGNHYARLAYRVSQQIGQWRMKPHAQTHFWRWVCSWARACRMPSDLGYDDAAFLLPELEEHYHTIVPQFAPDGMLFTLPAYGLNEERQERRRTIQERCERVAALVDHDRQAVVWCHLNDEGDMLERMISDAVQVKGASTDDQKMAAYEGFADGSHRVLIIKPKIGAWGLNWQHCHDVLTFVSHSYEQYYQSIRRCWRFGQTKPVSVHIVATKGEEYVKDNMLRKSQAAAHMFNELVAEMHRAESFAMPTHMTSVEMPSWL